MKILKKALLHKALLYRALLHKALLQKALTKITALIATAALIASAALVLPVAIAAAEPDEINIDGVIAKTVAFIMETTPDPGIGQTGGEWAVIALMRSGETIPDGYIRSYYDAVVSQLDIVRGLLSSVKYSEYSRVALAMAAVGADPRDVGGYDMLAPLSDYEMTVSQGLNGPIFALIALNGAGYGGDPVTERYVDFILSRQLPDGGFTLSGTNSDPDTTAMAITALSVYRSRGDIEEAVDRAVERLSRIQRATGGYTSFSSVNSESVSQVIIALCSMGISIDDERFVKDENSLLQNLMTYYVEGGGFEHESGGGISMMATEQALCALAAYRRYAAGQKPLYDMSDAPASLPDRSDDEPSGKHPDVSVPAVLPREVSFEDTGGHDNENAIIELAQRGIVNGYANGCFLPDNEISRAEFTAMMVRALGLHGQNDLTGFADVEPGSWYGVYVSAACAYGVIEGRGAGIFDPGSIITKQEAAVIVTRAAAMCGLSRSFDDTAVRDILSQFIDYRTVGQWAAEALAFCYYYGILDDSAIEITPALPLSRGAAAELLFRVLNTAGLL